MTFLTDADRLALTMRHAEAAADWLSRHSIGLLAHQPGPRRLRVGDPEVRARAEPRRGVGHGHAQHSDVRARA